MNTTFLQIKIKEDIACVSLNRPEKRNALNPPLIKELLSFFKKPALGGLRAIVLKGKGKAFCSGADLNWLSQPPAADPKDLDHLFSVLNLISTYPLPIVAVAQGFAVGGGLGLLACADIVLAEKDTQFRFSETRLGLVPSIISPFVLKKIGLSQARFLMLSAMDFSASQALNMGLVHFVGTEAKCQAHLQKLLSHLKTLNPSAVTETKRWLNRLSSLPPLDFKKEAVQIIEQKIKEKLNPK